MSIFNDEMNGKAIDIIARYPEKRSAVMPLLWLVQEEHGYISNEAVAEVADLIDETTAHVEMITSFYEMYHRHPVGKRIVRVCTNISCALRGADEIASHLKQKLGVDWKETTPDGEFTLEECECIAACCGAPAILLGNQLVENMTIAKADEIFVNSQPRESNRGSAS